ncbi:MAG: hypothetical protein Q4A55_07570 [Aerococcus sp.]|nr:hypothetical protein [Aerococcus sp.]
MVCDLAETYHILNYRELPAGLVATLANGLSDDSRIKRKLSGQAVTTEILLLGALFDQLNALMYGMSNAKQKPPSILQRLMGEQADHQVFYSGEAFNRARQQMIKQMNGGEGNCHK